MLGAFCRISLRFSSGLGTFEDWRLEFLWMLELGAWNFAAPQFDPGLGCGSAALCLCASVIKNFSRRSRPHQRYAHPGLSLPTSSCFNLHGPISRFSSVLIRAIRG